MRASLVVIAALLTQVASAQGTTVSGTVRDSLAGTPLAGALVQLVTADTANATPRTVVSDSNGHYRIEGIARGRYVISFLHPLLDSLALEPILHSLEVAGGPAVIYDLGTPSGKRLRAAFCPGSAKNAGAAFVGVTRDASTGEPVADVSVVAEWVDMVIGRGGATPRAMRRAATSATNGWFALCDLPGPGLVTVHAADATDTTDLIDLAMPASLFARRDLYLGSTSRGRVEGRVITSQNRSSLAGAIVRIGTAVTRTGTDGAWSLADLPGGTRILEVHAIGYYPDRQPVDVIREPTSVTVQMATFESVLDTVRVRTSALVGVDEGGFEKRRRSSGSGHFLTEEDIRRRAPIETSDIFKTVSGVAVLNDGIAMRSAFSPDGCVPTVFIDGHVMPPMDKLSAFELDSWIRPSEISSVEVYPDVPPPQFQTALSGCGSIVFWTKRKLPPRKPLI